MKKIMVLLAAMALVGAFTVTAMATEWNFYGSARMTTFWDDYDEDAGDDADMTWNLQGNARIGATVTGDVIGGGFEYGSGPNLRKLYGTYNFNGGQLLIGQTYTPLGSMFYSNQVWGADEDLLSIGQCYRGRQPMIQLSMQGLKIALVKPNNPGVPGLTGDKDTTLPQIEVSYNLKTDAFFMDIFGGYQTYSIENVTTPNFASDYDVDAFVAGIGGGLNMGPAYLKAGIYMAKNASQYGLYSGVNNADTAVGVDGEDIIDNDSIGALGVLGFKAGDKMTFEVGCGYVQYELDVENAEKDDAMSYYGNVTIDIAPGFFIVPEIGVIDYMDDSAGNEQGSMFYAGAKWQINF